MESNLKVHVDFGYDHFYIDYSEKKIYASSNWSGKCENYIGEFTNEHDLREKIGKCVGKRKDFYFKYSEKWDL